MANPIKDALAALQRGEQAFMTPPASTNPLDQVPGLRNIRAFNVGTFGKEATDHPMMMVGGEARFGRFAPMHPEDMSLAAQAIERFNNNKSSLEYATNQGVKDEALIRQLAKHYVGNDLLSKFKNNTGAIAQELLNRIRVDQKQPQVSLP
jgi:hypothetical protein